MQYRFPKWLAYAVAALIVLLVTISAYAVKAMPATRVSVGGNVFGLLGVCMLTFLMWVYLYVRRYRIQIENAAVIVRSAFLIKTIPLSSVAQVITVSTPRGGTVSWLVGKNDAVLAKVDGGLVGFEALLVDLGERLRPYQALFYRRGIWGAWEMQVAGDSHWVPNEAPRLVRESNRRVNIIMVIGCTLIAIAVAFSVWLKHGGFDKLP